MRNPCNNSYFPLSEYERRVERIGEALRENMLDAILLAQQYNVTYSSGMLHGSWKHSFGESTLCVLITARRGDEPTLVTQEGLRGCTDTSAFSDIRILKNFLSSEGIASISALFAEKGLTGARIGYENLFNERMGFTEPFFKKVKEELPGVEWVEASNIMYSIRKVKSPLEIEKVRTAVELTCRAYEYALPRAREGMSEKELGGMIASFMASNCIDVCVNEPWFIYVHADGKNPLAWDGVPSDYRFKKGDCLYVDCGFCYQGYSADFIRVVSIGEPQPEKARIYYGAREANMALIEHIRPGMKCSELFEFLGSKISSLGFSSEVKAMSEYGFFYEGHGIGLSLHEPPVITPDCDDIIVPNMTMSIEGNIFTPLPFSQKTICLKNEENILVTQTGCERLSNISNDIWIV